MRRDSTKVLVGYFSSTFVGSGLVGRLGPNVRGRCDPPEQGGLSKDEGRVAESGVEVVAGRTSCCESAVEPPAHSAQKSDRAPQGFATTEKSREIPPDAGLAGQVTQRPPAPLNETSGRAAEPLALRVRVRAAEQPRARGRRSRRPFARRQSAPLTTPMTCGPPLR